MHTLQAQLAAAQAQLNEAVDQGTKPARKRLDSADPGPGARPMTGGEPAPGLTGPPTREMGPGPILVDAADYTPRMLLSGAPTPWADPGALGAYLSRSAALLAPDALLLDLADAWTPGPPDPALTTAMAQQTRRTRPLRALLEDTTCRDRVAEAVRVAAAAARLPVVAVIPSPTRWAAAANRLAGIDATVDETSTEAASMYIAGALGGFAEDGISAVLIDEADTPAANLPNPEAYRPIANAARHLGWDVLVRTDDAPAWPHGPSPAISTWIGGSEPVETTDAPWGLVRTFTADPHGTAGAPRIMVVPRDTDPDAAAAVRSWRGQ